MHVSFHPLACTSHKCSGASLATLLTRTSQCARLPRLFFHVPQAEVQSVRTDGQVQLHVRDAVASKLPPGMLVSLPPTLVRPQRKHLHQCGSSGEGV